jgi:hypothetical protein
VVKRKQPSLTIDEAFQRFYRQEKNPHVACEQLNQALREGLTLWVVDLRVQLPEDERQLTDAERAYFAIPPKKRQPTKVTPDYFARNFRVAVEQAPDGGWIAKVTTVGRALMPPADLFEWTVSAPGVNRLLKSESSSGRKRGAKPEYDWTKIDREIHRRCVDAKTKQGQVPDNESELARDILEWCQTEFNNEPAESAMREHVRRICALF